MLAAKPTFTDLVGALVAIGGVVIVGYLAVTGSEQAGGAIVALVAAATGWLFRGRLEQPRDTPTPTTPSTPPAPAPPTPTTPSTPPGGRGAP